MNPILVLAILAICTVPAYAQSQQPDIAKLKADAENMVKVISGDKLKIQTYCQILDLHDQIDDANLNQDIKKATELSEQADELEKKLGPADLRRIARPYSGPSDLADRVREDRKGFAVNGKVTFVRLGKGRSNHGVDHPNLVEICIGLEINGYLPATF
jgi:hypothetical protein